MTVQAAIEISLNLHNVQVLACNENGKEYMVRASSVEPQRACPECPSEEVIGFGTKEQKIMDLPMHGKQVGINFIRQRFRCKACEYTFYEPIYFADEKRHATRRFVERLEEQTLRRSHTSLALEFGLDEKTVRNIFRDYVSRLAETVKFETPTRMGIDEIHILDQARAVITNIENRTVVDLLPNRKKDAVVAYLKNMPDKERVRVVAIRAMNRIGRGYSFDALRAKILFTQGFVKKKPKPTSLRARRKAEEMSWADVTMDWIGADEAEPEIYLGADIDKLIQYFESEHVRD